MKTGTGKNDKVVNCYAARDMTLSGCGLRELGVAGAG